MRRTGVFVLLAVAVSAAPALAQEDLLSACATANVVYLTNGIEQPGPPPGSQRDNVENQLRFLCGQTVSALTNVQPTFGIAFTGGAHTLGTASTLGRRLGVFPRISVTGRLNLALAEVPTLLDDYAPTFDSNGDIPAMGTTNVPVGSLQGDLVVGLFNGFSAGPALGGLGSIDLLGSVSFVPAVEETGLAEDIVNWGVGARIGIIKQGLVMPGVSVSGMYRSMGDVSFGSVEDGDPAEFGTDLSTVSLRAGVSKGILAFDLAAGAGYDIYTSNVHFDVELECPSGTCPVPASVRPREAGAGPGEFGLDGELTTAAWNVYGNVGLSLLLLNVVGEVGYQKATEVISAADLADAGLPDRDPTAEELGGGRFFGSLGVRLTF